MSAGWASLIAKLAKNLPEMQETPENMVRFLGQKIRWRRVGYPLQNSWASLVVQLIKNPPAMLET